LQTFITTCPLLIVLLVLLYPDLFQKPDQELYRTIIEYLVEVKNGSVSEAAHLLSVFGSTKKMNSKKWKSTFAETTGSHQLQGH
jgi:hypothetical protein